MKKIDPVLLKIREKITDIKVAIFQPEATNEFSLPPNVVYIKDTDEEGNIWFYTSSNSQNQGIEEKKLYASLNFIKKGYSSKIEISGPAEVVENNYTLEGSTGENEHMILLKLKIMNASFTDHPSHNDSNIVKKIRNVYHYLFTNNVQHGEFHMNLAKSQY